MPYTSNPYAPKARKHATNLVKAGYSPAEIARRFGVHRSTVGRWMKRATKHSGEHIRTKSSRPRHHPNQLPQKLVNKVIQLRKQTGRCAAIIYALLQQEHISVSLSSVKRILKRNSLLRRKKRHIKTETRFRRPVANSPGSLVEMDTIHFVRSDGTRFYLYAVIDTYSRIGYAEYQPRISTKVSAAVAKRARIYFDFTIAVLQTDNGAEFSDYFGEELQRVRIRLRHTRVRKPNDNAHVERFIRTIQEECFHGFLPSESKIRKQLVTYITYYNHERIHLGIQCLTPMEMLQSS